MSHKIILFLVLILGINMGVYAQNKDSVQVKNSTEEQIVRKNPKLAAYLSLAVPGAGQIYNEKYYKIPIIYSAFSSLLFFAQVNNNLYKEFLDRYSAYGLPGPVKYYEDNIPENILKKYKEYYRRNRDLMYIGVGVTYLLNVLDAVVDAHMSYFDVGEIPKENTFSLKVRPNFIPVNYNLKPIPGVSIIAQF